MISSMSLKPSRVPSKSLKRLLAVDVVTLSRNEESSFKFKKDPSLRFRMTHLTTHIIGSTTEAERENLSYDLRPVPAP
jgi:hypothetical protein